SAGQPHEQPAGHVRGTGRQRSYARWKLAAGEHVVVEVGGLEVGVITDAKHGEEIHGDGDQLIGLVRHGNILLCGLARQALLVSSSIEQLLADRGEADHGRTAAQSSPCASRLALPPMAAVLMVRVRSVTKRSR